MKKHTAYSLLEKEFETLRSNRNWHARVSEGRARRCEDLEAQLKEAQVLIEELVRQRVRYL